MQKLTRLSIQWFYDILDKGECELVDFKEQLEDKIAFGKSLKNFSASYDELAKDVVAFANKKGGFIFIGIVDVSKEINPAFEYKLEEVFKLIKQVQDRTNPSITLKPYTVLVAGKQLLILEIPFSNQLHRTSKGEYIVRNFDGNKAIEAHEIATIQAEKGLIVYDQKLWKLNFKSSAKDAQCVDIPGWQDIEKTRDLYLRIKQNKPQSPYLKNSSNEFTETLGLIKEEDDKLYPTTTGVLFIGNTKALREIPYNQIKYIRYYEDGTYTPFEYSGNLIDVADACFAQLKSETKLKEFHFGLFREYIEDYPEVVLREMLMNAIAHRDYSRQQIIEIRKYPNYIEFESPGSFPQGINEQNFLRKTNPRNPSIMDVLREINYAEKAGSGFDKIFTALLTKGKQLPKPLQTDNSIVFTIQAEVFAQKLAELSLLYKQLTKTDIDLEKLLVLNHIYTGQKITFTQLENAAFVNKYQLRKILTQLQELELIETTGKTSDVKYIIHKSKLETTEEKITYTKQKKQEKARQIEAIIRYLENIDDIDNEAARKLLNIPDTNASHISRLFADMIEEQHIEIAQEKGHNQRTYKLKTKPLQRK